jgi:hypothetical protein
MSLVDEIREWWGWTGIDPQEVVGDNPFGNVMVKDSSGKYWRICPEDGYCKVVADSRAELDILSHDQTFLEDWYMRSVVALAEEKCGALAEGRKYCLKIPGFMGGEYAPDNIATISQLELIRFSGHLAKETADLPDGSKVRLKVVD